MKFERHLRSVQVGGTLIDILGTAHVSRASCEQVTRLLDEGEYDTVAVELCDRRCQAICNPGAGSRIDLWQAIREKKLGAIAGTVALGVYQQRLADSLGVELGGEMKKAVTLAREKGLSLVLLDRDIGITLKRLYRSVSWWRRVVFVNSMIYGVFTRQKISADHVEQMKESDTLAGMLEELQAIDSCLYRIVIDERDRYMSAGLLTHARRDTPARVLAVVGAGHVPGMVRELQSYLTDGCSDLASDIAGLEQVPLSSRWAKLFPWAIPAVILAGFAAGFGQDVRLGSGLVFDWILINGGLAALGAFLAGGHPLTVLAAFLAAPFTSINPTIGAGMVSAAIELYLRKPLVEDFENIRRDTVSWSGWRRNRVARILLIFLYTSVGSAAGTYIGGFHIYGSL